MKKRIVLGSKSFGRRQLLDRAGVRYETMIADIDEKKIKEKDPRKLVLKLARAKADAIVANCGKDVILVTSDCIAVCHGEILEKPESREDIYHFFDLYSHYPVSVISSVIVTDINTGESKEAVGEATITFSPFSAVEIEQLAGEDDTYRCAGGFMIEHPMAQKHVLSLEGDKSAIIGMPIEQTLEFILLFEN